MKTFEEEVIEVAKNSVLRQLSTANFVYFATRDQEQLGKAVMTKVMEQLDMNEIVSACVKTANERIGGMLVHHLLRELGQDVRSIMQDAGLRERLRAKVLAELKS